MTMSGWFMFISFSMGVYLLMMSFGVWISVLNADEGLGGYVEPW